MYTGDRRKRKLILQMKTSKQWDTLSQSERDEFEAELLVLNAKYEKERESIDRYQSRLKETIDEKTGENLLQIARKKSFKNACKKMKSTVDNYGVSLMKKRSKFYYQHKKESH